MKIIEFEDFFCVLKENAETTPEQGVKQQTTASKQQSPPEKTAPKKDLQRDAENFAMPDSFLKAAKISGDMELEILSNAMVLTNRTMTVLEVLNVLESLEEKCRDYYRCLTENFMEDVDEAGCDCEFCQICMKTNDMFPEFLKALQENVPLDQGLTPDLGCVSPEMVERLHDMGLCLSEINFAIMDEEEIYFGSPKS
ncbi:MAG: hypothetical protein R3Y63_09405 [Eubacteriales bacterium]